MKNICRLVLVLWTCVLPQVLDAQVFASVEALRPMDVFVNPWLLQSGGFEEAIPKDNYSPQEAQIQSALNAKAADALLVWSPLAGEQEWTEYDTEPITPFTWRWVDMEVLHYDGAVSQVHLLRPKWWLSDMGADVSGNVLFVEMPEVGITGEAHVTNIRPTQLDTRFWDENRQGDFVSRPITGKFEHTSSDVYHLFFGRDTVPLGVTGNHRIWSKDRKDWVEAAHLRIGEAVLTRDSASILIARQKLDGEHQVFNLEVYRDHNFLVSVQGVVVHNTCGFDDLWEKSFARKGDSKGVRWADSEASALSTFEELMERAGVSEYKAVSDKGYEFVSADGKTKTIVRSSTNGPKKGGGFDTIEVQKKNKKGGFSSDREIRFDNE